MALPQSKVTAQGQISVPAEIRKKLGIGPGTVLEWEQDGEQLLVRKAGRYSSQDIHGAIFARRPRARALDELRKSIVSHLKAKHEGR